MWISRNVKIYPIQYQLNIEIINFIFAFAIQVNYTKFSKVQFGLRERLFRNR